MIGYIYLVTKRWAQHVSLASRGSSFLVHRAIRKHGASSFLVEIIETVEGTHDDLMAAEIRHIAAQGCLVPNGYNLTPGGEGVDLTIPEVRQKYTASMDAVYANPDWRASVAAANRRKESDPEFVKHRAEAMATMHADPQYQRVHAESHRRMAENPEWKADQAERNRALVHDPEWQAAMCQLVEDPEWQKAHAEGVRRRGDNHIWLEKVTKAGTKTLEAARAAKAAKLADLDAALSLEERARRVKNREYVAKSRAKKRMKSDAHIHNAM